MHGSKINQRDFVEMAWGAEYTELMTQSIKWLQDEIADRMLQKLDIVRLDAKSVLLIPELPRRYFLKLKKRFPSIRVDSVYEENHSGLASIQDKLLLSWQIFFEGAHRSPFKDYVETGKLALPDSAVDLIFCDLLIQDLPDPIHFLQECWCILREGGLLTFSYLGPDTGKELRALEGAPLKLKNLVSPWDMHDMGDALLRERFSDPVMDMEYLYLEYETEQALYKDGLALGLISQDAQLEELNKQIQPLMAKLLRLVGKMKNKNKGYALLGLIGNAVQQATGASDMNVKKAALNQMPQQQQTQQL